VKESLCPPFLINVNEKIYFVISNDAWQQIRDKKNYYVEIRSVMIDAEGFEQT